MLRDPDNNYNIVDAISNNVLPKTSFILFENQRPILHGKFYIKRVNPGSLCCSSTTLIGKGDMVQLNLRTISSKKPTNPTPNLIGFGSTMAKITTIKM